jgi:hypothetical protein
LFLTQCIQYRVWNPISHSCTVMHNNCYQLKVCHYSQTFVLVYTVCLHTYVHALSGTGTVSYTVSETSWGGDTALTLSLEYYEIQFTTYNENQNHHTGDYTRYAVPSVMF